MLSESWLALLIAAEHGGRQWLAAIKHAGSPDVLLGSSDKDLAQLGLGRSARRRLRHIDRAELSAHRRWLDGPDRGLVTIDSEHYPCRLAELADAPLALWTRGPALALLGSPQLAVVGSRQPTSGGRRTAELFARRLSRAGLTVTSGLAAGIDAAGHTGALDGVGGTIAVLGTGIDGVYPRSNRALARRIAARGLIVSEYPPGAAVRAFQFPRRNRIIAGLSLGTLVVEANSRSGALITARLAADCGREVFAIPGSIHSELSKGCHRLLRQGATLVESLEDILLEIAPSIAWELPATRPDEDGINARDSVREPPDWLDFSPATLEELVLRSGLTAAELSSMLLHLEMEGTVEALPGGRYCRLVKRG